MSVEALEQLLTDPGFAGEIAEISESEAALVDYMAELCQLPQEEQHAALSAWARSPLWGAPLMLLTGWQGAVSRAAYDALKIDLMADTPARRWVGLDVGKGRASIIRLLGLEGVPAAVYAALAFRTWPDDDGRTWIAGAIGCEPVLGEPRQTLSWTHLDITEVLLWDPRTNEVRIAGEHRSTSRFVLPEYPDDRLMVWGDPGAFFRAWAGRRARTGQLAQRRAAGHWAHPISEPSDSDLPGGLLVGSYLRAHWPAVAASTVVAADGLTPAELHFAVVRAARLPQIQGA